MPFKFNHIPKDERSKIIAEIVRLRHIGRPDLAKEVFFTHFLVPTSKPTHRN